MARRERDFDQNMDNLRRNLQKIFGWFRRYPLSIFFLVLFLLLLLFLPTVIYSVDAQERAVVLRFGKFNRVEEPGLRYKLPYPIERAHLVNTQEPFEMNFTTTSTRRRASRSMGVRNPEKLTLMLTGDLGVARVEWTVQYKKTNPTKYLFNVKDEKHLIRETTMATMRRIIGDKFVTRVITVARAEIRRAVEKELQKVLDQYSTGITIDGIEIQQTEPPVQKVIDAFKEVDSARQDRETLRNEALRQKEKILNETKGEVEQRKSEARGEAAQIRNQARGEAERFEHMVKQFEAAPKITRTRMFLETMQEVMNKSDRVYVVDQEIKGLLPHLQLQEQK